MTQRLALSHPDLPHAITARQPFNCNGSLTADTGRYFGGRLPLSYCNRFYTDSDAPDFYAIYSYSTPIAWYSNGQWTIPDVYYSVTTTRHQNIVRKAILDA